MASKCLYTRLGKSSESVQCTITGPCLRMRDCVTGLQHSALYRFRRFALSLAMWTYAMMNIPTAVTFTHRQRTHGYQSTRHTVNSSQPKIVWRVDRWLKHRVVTSWPVPQTPCCHCCDELTARCCRCRVKDYMSRHSPGARFSKNLRKNTTFSVSFS